MSYRKIRAAAGEPIDREGAFLKAADVLSLASASAGASSSRLDHPVSPASLIGRFGESQLLPCILLEDSWPCRSIDSSSSRHCLCRRALLHCNSWDNKSYHAMYSTRLGAQDNARLSEEVGCHSSFPATAQVQYMHRRCALRQETTLAIRYTVWRCCQQSSGMMHRCPGAKRRANSTAGYAIPSKYPQCWDKVKLLEDVKGCHSASGCMQGFPSEAKQSQNPVHRKLNPQVWSREGFPRMIKR